MKYSKTLERTEAKKESEETQELVQLAEVDVVEQRRRDRISGGGR